jgi:hypothetical protein
MAVAEVKNFTHPSEKPMDRYFYPCAQRGCGCPRCLRWPNNPTYYNLPQQVSAWPLCESRPPKIGHTPNMRDIDRARMYHPTEGLEFGLFWHPIPDPMFANTRPVLFQEDPVKSGLRAHIVETGMSGGNPLCGRGGYPGF